MKTEGGRMNVFKFQMALIFNFLYAYIVNVDNIVCIYICMYICYFT